MIASGNYVNLKPNINFIKLNYRVKANQKTKLKITWYRPTYTIFVEFQSLDKWKSLSKFQWVDLDLPFSIARPKLMSLDSD